MVLELVKLDNYHGFKGEKYREILEHAKHLNNQKKIENIDKEEIQRLKEEIF